MAARCRHPNAQPSRFGRRWWCPDCRKHIEPPTDEPATEYERVAQHVMRDVLGWS